MSEDRRSDLLELYLLGELSEADAADVEAWLRDDPSAAQALATARELLGRLDSLLAPPAGADQLAERIVRALPGRAPRRLLPIRWAIGLGAAAAVAACVALALWFPRPPEIPDHVAGGSTKPELAGWRIEPTGRPDFQVEASDRIKLVRGELLLEAADAANRPELTIDTPAGTVTAASDRFYIACYPKGEAVNPVTRVLVLSGVVTLTTALGSVTGQANHLLQAEKGKPPVNLAVTANGDFAFDLYGQLAKAKADKNLFFSPYSLSVALAMAAEGARGETAEQMGKALRFPEAARRVGDDAQLLPWNAALIHTGFAALSKRFNEANNAVPLELQNKIAGLRKELDRLNQLVRQTEKKRDYQEALRVWSQAQQVAGQLNGELAKVDRYELRVANALWGEKSYPFRQSYVDTINKYFETGGVFPVDFRNNPEAARRQINDWVETQTRNRIKDLLPANALNPDAWKLVRLVLTNAIYFKGAWAEDFRPGETRPEDFTTAVGAKVQAPLMRRGSHPFVRYAAFRADGTPFETPDLIGLNERDESKFYPDANGFTLLELPYKGDELSMVVLLPRSPNGLGALEGRLSGANLLSWVEKLRHRSVHVLLPKFKMQSNLDLNAPLQALGMVRAFEDPRKPDGAQFDGMSASQNPEEKLYIGKVLHKAFVEVNEKGTEAAAATALVMPTPGSAAVPRRPFTPTFRADHAFVFLIRDRATGTVLFLGRVTDPTQTR
jgi:serine protease inhibitor